MRSILFLFLCAAACSGSRAATSAGPAAGESGAELWAASCRRCHAMRDPADYSDAEWRVVILHMRVRANLDDGEVRAILAFLTSGE